MTSRYRHNYYRILLIIHRRGAENSLHQSFFDASKTPPSRTAESTCDTKKTANEQFNEHVLLIAYCWLIRISRIWTIWYASIFQRNFPRAMMRATVAITTTTTTTTTTLSHVRIDALRNAQHETRARATTCRIFPLYPSASFSLYSVSSFSFSLLLFSLSFSLSCSQKIGWYDFLGNATRLIIMAQQDTVKEDGRGRERERERENDRERNKEKRAFGRNTTRAVGRNVFPASQSGIYRRANNNSCKIADRNINSRQWCDFKLEFNWCSIEFSICRVDLSVSFGNIICVSRRFR